MYIYHFVYGKNTGVFTHFIGNNKNLVNPKKIKLNKTYYLILQKEIEASAKTEIVEKSYYENGILIWKTGMKSEYYSSCLNVDNDKIVPKFTLIKYVDTNDKY